MEEEEERRMAGERCEREALKRKRKERGESESERKRMRANEIHLLNNIF